MKRCLVELTYRLQKQDFTAGDVVEVDDALAMTQVQVGGVMVRVFTPLDERAGAGPTAVGDPAAGEGASPDAPPAVDEGTADPAADAPGTAEAGPPASDDEPEPKQRSTRKRGR